MSKKIVFLLSIAMFFFLARLSLTNLDETPEVIFCDVGQGDAALIQKGTFQLLIDAGPDESVTECLQNNMPFGDQTLDFVVISHPHADHYQGLNNILGKYRVANLMMPDVPQVDKEYMDLYNRVNAAVINGTLQTHDATVNMDWRFFDDLGFRIVFATEKCSPEDIFEKKLSEAELSALEIKCTQNDDNINNVSIGLILDIEHILFTFTGDLEEVGELAMVERELLTEIDVLKVPHHGSKTSSSTQFLESLKPKIAVISVGANNSYKHPTAEVLARLTEQNATIYRTDEDGEVHFRIENGELQYAK